MSFDPTLVSLTVQRHMDRAQNSLQQAVRRLSSGLRVNDARDDAAGSAIASRMTAQVRGMAAALRNANDGISLFQTADHALGQMSENLQRMRELALQARNGTMAPADREALDRELQQMLDEVDRIAAHTAFNSRPCLDGSLGPMQFAIGARSSDVIDVDLGDSVRTDDIGAIATAVSRDLRTIESGSFAIASTYTSVPLSNLDFSRPAVAFSGGRAVVSGPPTNYSGGQSASFAVDGIQVDLTANYGSLAGVANAIQSQLDAGQNGAYAVVQDGSSVTIVKTAGASANTTAPSISALSGPNAGVYAGATATNGTAAAATTRAGFSVDGHAVSLTADYSGNVGGVIADIQAQLDATSGGASLYTVAGSEAGISIVRNGGGATPVLGSFTGAGASVFARAPVVLVSLAVGDLSVQVGDGPAVTVTGTFSSAAALAAGIESQVPGIVASINAETGALEIDSPETITLAGAKAQPGGDLAFQQLVNEPSGSLSESSIASSGTCARTVMRIDASLDSVNALRATFGAQTARFDAIVDSLQSQSQLLEAARSRIVDADFAQETTEMARQRVLRSAGLAMLAQANTSARDVLRLL